MGQRFDGPDAGFRVGPNFDVIISDLEEGQHFNDHVNGMKSCGKFLSWKFVCIL